MKIALKKPAAMLAALLMHHTYSALAVSGGVMGGSSFSSGSSSSDSYSSDYSSSSSSYPTRTYSHSGDSSDSEPRKRVEHGAVSESLFILMVIVAFVIVALLLWYSYTADQTTFVKLQIGLLGTARELQRELTWIAETADTSNRVGFTNILRETISSLLRHPQYFISGYSFVEVEPSVEKVEPSVEKVEKCFKRHSNVERGKFDKVTLINIDNVKLKTTISLKTSESPNEYIVITMLVAAKGEHKLGAINDSKDLKEALEKLNAIPTSSMLAVEVLWTPQDLNDTLSEKELLRDYPLLMPLEEMGAKNE